MSRHSGKAALKMHLWMFFIGLLCISSCRVVESAALDSGAHVSKESVLEVMDRVAQWQLANPTGKELWVWEYGTFYAGLMSYYKINRQQEYLDSMLSMGEQLQWQLKPNPYIADNFAIAQTYIDMYEIVGDPAFIDKTQYVMDMAFHKRPSRPDLRWSGNPHKLDWWSWSDALFMAPPAFAQMSKVTGDPKYLDEMHRLWRLTYEYLYDADEMLFFRDDSYFEPRTRNGKKIFWSRGNGWVVGGLVRVLEVMPEDYPNRQFYENVLQQMATRLIQLQAPDGYWYPSLLDKHEYDVKETSGTAFFCYALAWGISHQLLDRNEFLPHVMSAWKSLQDAVQEDGKLGYVQRVGVGPDEVRKEDSETYGTGAFLMCGSALYRLIAEVEE